jgi:hypothetical protein
MRTEGPRGRQLIVALLALALGAHAIALAQSWKRVARAEHGRDFASYYYAVDAASSGADPYDVRAIGALAHAEGTHSSVHPYLYPPPFLGLMSWTQAFSLREAYRTWFWLDSLFLLAALLALFQLWPRTSTAVAIGVLLASFTPILDTHVMGQANLLVLALLCWGVLLTTRGRAGLGGALVGAACMFKPLPGLLLLWWVVSLQWRALGGAAAAALFLSLLTLPLLGASDQLRFYLVSLPGIGGGSYGGLAVPIEITGNHSIANLWASVWPLEDGISVAARWASLLCTGAILGFSLFALRRRPQSASAVASSFAALCSVLLLLPFYSFEHHLVFTIPAWIAVAAAVADRQLGRTATVALGGAYLFMAWPLQHLRWISESLPAPAGRVMLESKFAAILILALVTLQLARPPPPAARDEAS